MSGVVLRCPNCGTTKAASGECAACHEAQVRYYCTNHSPGRWLDAPACPQCGARFGASPAGPPVTARPPAPVRRVPDPAGAPHAEAPRGERRRPPVEREPSTPGGEELPRGGPPIASWQEMLLAAARATRAHREAAPVDTGPAPSGPRLGGCVVRFVLLLLFLFLTLFGGIFLFVGQLFSPF